MNVACSQGCFCCKQRGDGPNQTHSPGCCHSTLCEPDSWEEQTRTWLREETRWKRQNNPEITRWLIAETLWKEQLTTWLAAEAEWKVQLVLWLAAKDEFRREMREKQQALMARRTTVAPRKGRAKQTSATIAAQVALSKAEAGVHHHP